MKKFEKPSKVNPLDPLIAKEAYQQNLTEITNRFKECLAETEELEPSFSNFKGYATFMVIKQQEEFVKHIKKNGHQFAKEKQEEALLDKFIVEAKAKFGDERYRAWVKLLLGANE